MYTQVDRCFGLYNLPVTGVCTHFHFLAWKPVSPHTSVYVWVGAFIDSVYVHAFMPTDQMTGDVLFRYVCLSVHKIESKVLDE